MALMVSGAGGRYGFPDGKAMYCAEHQRPGMVDLKDKKCEFPLCRKIPSYGFEGQRPRVCGEHKGHGMVNVSGKGLTANSWMYSVRRRTRTSTH